MVKIASEHSGNTPHRRLFCWSQCVYGKNYQGPETGLFVLNTWYDGLIYHQWTAEVRYKEIAS